MAKSPLMAAQLREGSRAFTLPHPPVTPKCPHTRRDINSQAFLVLCRCWEGAPGRKSCRGQSLKQKYMAAGGGECRHSRGCKGLGAVFTTPPARLGYCKDHSSLASLLSLGRIEAKIQPSHLGDFGLSGDRTGPLHFHPWKDAFE